MKPVITVGPQKLTYYMRKIWLEVSNDQVAPDGIVGIATGGLVCANIISEDLNLPLLEITIRRPSTNKKSNTLTITALRLLPYYITNWLRRFEDWKLERQTYGLTSLPRSVSSNKNAVFVASVAKVVKHVEELNLSHLVIIDDAVDSGITLGRVMHELRASLPSQVQLTSAVVCQSRARPLYVPDIALHSMCLCRFPWSLDYRGE